MAPKCNFNRFDQSGSTFNLDWILSMYDREVQYPFCALYFKISPSKVRAVIAAYESPPRLTVFNLLLKEEPSHSTTS